MRKGLSIEQLKTIYSRIASRYDLQHGLITAKSDQRGRRMVVEKTVRPGDDLLDVGAGTGSTGLLAARKTGAGGSVTLFDLSDDMLAVAREKIAKDRPQARVLFETGDMCSLPFADDSFDAVVSSYSLCPLYDPAQGALEMYRVVKPGGRIGIAHSAEPVNPAIKWLADNVEDIAWKIPSLSLGCRAVDVAPVLEQAGGKVVFNAMIGIALWPFRVLIIEKPGKQVENEMNSTRDMI
ncbi:MAG: class I SAM-dependent methyltransferase [Mariprofundus sp.]